MRYSLLLAFLFLHSVGLAQTRFEVSSVTEFNTAQGQAVEGDSIVWLSGVYSDVRMDINQDGLVVTAEESGTVVFNGVSRATINADHTTFSGFQYIGGFISTLDVIRVYGSDILITQINIQNYTCFKYLRVYEASRRTTISYCNFEHRINSADQNILSILVGSEPGYHKIQHCSFKNFDGIGQDQGVEPIRIGVSSQGNLDSRTLVEYCYFTRCNGDGEIISHKARQNVYRYNTFENNPVAELVLRHGDEGIVYGNFFLNGMGGVRVREGSDHFIYNNYFENMKSRVIYLINDPSDPLENIHIYHNTIIGSEEVRLGGGSGSNPPTNVILANNIFSTPVDKLFQEVTGNETWIGNYSFGNLGFGAPATGLTDVDPQLSVNSEGYFQPDSNSAVLGAASTGFPTALLYPGMDYDHEIELDLMQEPRPVLRTDQAIGASEFSSTVLVQPYATEMNSGPSYLFDSLINYVSANLSQLYVTGEGENKSVVVSSNINWTVTSSESWLSSDLLSGAGDSELTLTIDKNNVNTNRSATLTITGDTLSVTITVNQDPGDVVSIEAQSLIDVRVFPNPTDGSLRLSDLPAGISSSEVELFGLDGRSVFAEDYPIKENQLELDLDTLVPGTYLLKVKFLRENGTVYEEMTRKIVRK